jgi:hypothetical protein
MQQEMDMKNVMADYIATVLNARGIPYHMRPSGNGCVMFTFDDRMVAQSVVTGIFENAFSVTSGGCAEAKVTH